MPARLAQRALRSCHRPCCRGSAVALRRSRRGRPAGCLDAYLAEGLAPGRARARRPFRVPRASSGPAVDKAEWFRTGSALTAGSWSRRGPTDGDRAPADAVASDAARGQADTDRLTPTVPGCGRLAPPPVWSPATSFARGLWRAHETLTRGTLRGHPLANPTAPASTTSHAREGP